jgi:hypothetical protein
MSKPKIGQGHAAAMFRLGLKELRNAANPSKESVADTEIGLYGSYTQGEIAQARAGPGSGPEQESKKMSLDDLREFAKQKTQEAELKMDDLNKQQERGEMER